MFENLLEKLQNSWLWKSSSLLVKGSPLLTKGQEVALVLAKDLGSSPKFPHYVLKIDFDASKKETTKKEIIATEVVTENEQSFLLKRMSTPSRDDVYLDPFAIEGLGRYGVLRGYLYNFRNVKTEATTSYVRRIKLDNGQAIRVTGVDFSRKQQGQFIGIVL